MRSQLIVGLGNPGPQYARTRHNIGFMVLEALAECQGWRFADDRKFLGRVARGMVGEHSIILLLPMTYMNESGQSVRKVVDFFKLSPEGVVTVLDDIAIPFGELRLRERGSAGGHNGLKSIEQHLGTQETVRLRMGIGDRKQGDLSSHVLGRFTPDEGAELGVFIERAVQLLLRLMQGDVPTLLMSEGNRKPKEIPPASSRLEKDKKE